MRWVVAFVAYVYTHSRVQFHPAAYALMYATFFVAIMTALLFVMTLIFEALGTTGVALDYQTNAAVFGPVLFSELVRGNAKAWLGYRPEDWCFPAIGIGGFAGGGVFGAMMALKWGNPIWLMSLGCGAGLAAVYLLLGCVIRFGEKKSAAKDSGRVTG